MSILDRFESETFGPVLGPNFELFIIFGALEEFERLATRRLLSIPGAGSGGGWRWMAVDGGGWWRLVVDGGGWWWTVVDGGGGGLAESDSVCHCRCYPCCPCHSCGPFSLVDISLSLSLLHFLFLGDTRGGCPLYITVQHRMVCCRRSFGCQLPRQGQMKSTKPYSRKVLV